MPNQYDLPELEAYLDEALPPDQMAEIEDALRESETLREQLKAVNGRRDAGVHSVGGIWRRHRLSCPDRTELGSYLLGVLPGEQADFIKFHLEISLCRLCSASVHDLQAEQAATDQQEVAGRRKKYFQSSVGHLPRE